MQRQVETSVRSKILNLIQAWAHAFRNEPKYKVVQDTYQIMKVEGKDAGGKGGRTVAKQICFGGALQKEWALGLSLALVESGHIPHAGEALHNGALSVLPQVTCFQSSRKAMPCLLQKG